ncbi:chemotaxis response regulator protein-glutamate methylesterase [Alkalihalobacillus sp. BA299]|uniref:protein-glutamate methylesterase/protein-glutamine glutaminase n=1 Tax=Alkalihalobacillus sp. BA299 TaxID=2815938 RepID=UPI001AD9B679|nr:chemotaxis response regulator protein-glutamate methylesterase [Alkalihalobacillus sp. BA299]
MRAKITVLVVDDSAFMRKVISDLLQQDERIHVIGTARNGQDALHKLKTLKPTVITLDVEMPVMNGLETLKKIMETTPIPVVMISSTTLEGAKNTMLAMEYGAVDFIAKTSGAISLDIHNIKDEIIGKVVLAAQSQVSNFINNTKKIVTNTSNQMIIKDKEIRSFKNNGKKKVVAIGTSTGGPKALQQVLTKIPPTINAPILIVQHMPQGFTKSLANRLNSLCNIEVKEAEDGEIIKNGVAYLAPGGSHLTVKKVGSVLAACLNQLPPRKGHRPSVDVLFESLAKVTNYSVLSIIMTGMGADGTEGLLKLKDLTNTYSIAEAKESCIVFGMPRSAIKTNKVNEIVHLQNISMRVMELV